jgi:hypothetical protein
MYGVWHKLTDGFDIPSISSTLTYRPDWETLPLSEEDSQQLDAILNQEFTYIGKGSQCWVFASADDKYVIKFFKHYRLRTPEFLNHFPMNPLLDGYRVRKTAEKKDRLERAFRSYKISYDTLRPETGIVYVHLNKTHSLHKSITVYDKLDRRFDIGLDGMEFLIQKKGTQIYPTLSALMQKGEVEHAKRLLSNVVKLVIARSDKGVKDLDPFLRKNCGFFGDQAVFIDVGNFVPDESLKTYEGRKKEVAKVMAWIMHWLNHNYPELAEHVTNEVQSL